MNKLYEAVFREFEKEYIKTKKSFCIKNVERELIEKFNTARCYKWR